MHSVIEHIRSQAPANSIFYRLVGRLPGGEYALFPQDSHSFFRVGEAPRGMYPGLYQLFYFDVSGRQIQHARVELQLSEATAAALGPMESAPATAAASASRRAVAAPSAQLALPMSGVAPAVTASPTETAQAELLREQATHKMHLEREQQKHAFVQNATYAQEIGELMMIGRMMRQDMYELNNAAQKGSQDAFAQIEKQLEALRLLRQAQKETLAHVDAMTPPPPPPPKPDWTPLLHELINTAGAIGTALIQARLLPPEPKAVASKTQQPLPPPAASGTGPALERPTAPPARALPERPAASPIDWSALPERPESD